ncbi:MAG: limC 1 [Nocardia sp.]|uniref:mycofactocin-coupled SDR family oxidoreductase n=1 Tax=Nocardia sp. TaxID=1821 RepID=UPI0026284106|nr:mycofactocin-coupled SDR family oxidoreductase [Nocardia sp.]MCU1644359.1 limC 1 [Nocardia sp.]
MGRVAGKVAFVTGAGRGQGRSHAVRLAAEGADIIAVDICKNIGTVAYDLAGPEDLKETARLVEEQGRKIVTREADVRAPAELRTALEEGIRELGRLDVVVAQAGIFTMRGEPPLQAWSDVIDVNLIGTINAIQVALPHLSKGASVIATGSVAAFMARTIEPTPGADPGGAGYSFAKRALADYIHELARVLAPREIRANAVHPTNVNTTMLQNDVMYRTFRPDLDNPTREDAELAFPSQQAMPVPHIEPEDISNAIVYLASEESRFVTGMQMRVDAGAYLKLHGFHP